MTPRPVRSLPVLVLCGVWLAASGGLAAAGCASGSGTGSGTDETRTFTAVQVSAIPAERARILGALTVGQGSLTIFGSSTDSLFVSYVVSTPTPEGLTANQVETIDKQDSLFVTIRPTANSTIQLQVEAPEKLALHLSDEGRDVRVRNIENRVDVFRTGQGSLDLDDIEGPITIQDGTGPIRIHDARGPIVIDDEGGGITILDVKNGVRVETAGGDVTIEKIRDVSVFAGPGRLTIRNVSGSVSYRKTGSGEVTIERVAGKVEKL